MKLHSRNNDAPEGLPSELQAFSQPNDAAVVAALRRGHSEMATGLGLAVLITAPAGFLLLQALLGPVFASFCIALTLIIVVPVFASIVGPRPSLKGLLSMRRSASITNARAFAMLHANEPKDPSP